MKLQSEHEHNDLFWFLFSLHSHFFPDTLDKKKQILYNKVHHALSY